LGERKKTSGAQAATSTGEKAVPFVHACLLAGECRFVHAPGIDVPEERVSEAPEHAQDG
jgi:hypothetical protein